MTRATYLFTADDLGNVLNVIDTMGGAFRASLAEALAVVSYCNRLAMGVTDFLTAEDIDIAPDDTSTFVAPADPVQAFEDVRRIRQECIGKGGSQLIDWLDARGGYMALASIACAALEASRAPTPANVPTFARDFERREEATPEPKLLRRDPNTLVGLLEGTEEEETPAWLAGVLEATNGKDGVSQ